MAKITIITGHYGSGKTEFCIHYALHLQKQSIPMTLIDLDIVNPYFRSREKSELLAEKGIEVIASSLDHVTFSGDLPALSPKIMQAILSDETDKIVDVGGDGPGARVLARFADRIKMKSYDMFLVVNANRPNSSDLEKVIKHIDQIESESKLKINGLVNNTHLLRETTMEDIRKGNDLCHQISQKLNIPLVYTVVPKHLKNEIDDSKIGNVLFLNELYMRPDWL